jgi:DNA-binding FadR family transcriptional regulator
MGNAIVKCLQCNSGPSPDQETRDVIEAYVAAYAAKKKEKDTKLNMKKLLKSF